MSAARTTDRQKSFKKGIDADFTRRRREDTTIQIRKTIKEDRLNQRRRMIVLNEHSPAEDAIMVAHGYDHTAAASAYSVTIEDLPKIAAMIHSLDPLEQTTAVSHLRRLLSLESNPPIEEVINLGVVPLLTNYLRMHDKPELQFESAWALTNIASSTTNHTEVVIRHGAVPVLCELLLSSNDDVCEQAVWALGNISGDSPQCRDLVLNSGAMLPLLAVLRRSSGKVSILRNATWTLSNFCRGKPKADFTLVSPALTLLPHLIHSPDEEVATDALWTLSYLSEGSIDCVQAVIEAGICAKVVDLVSHHLTAIQTPALRTIGNIVTGDEQQTQTILDLAVLPRLLPLLKHHKKLIRKEACWTISNITAGTQSQIQEVIDANIIPPLLYQLCSEEFDVRKEAAWAIANATTGGTNDQIQYLVNEGCIPPLIKLLDCHDTKVIHVCLDTLENILRAGDAMMTINGDNKMAQHIEESEGVEMIQQLQYHNEQDIYEKAMHLIKEYYDGEDDDDLDYAPEIDYGARQFEFGVNAEAAASQPPYNF